VINYVLQPPCNGAAIAMEVWAIGGPDVRLERFGNNSIAVSYDSVRWVYASACRDAVPAVAQGTHSVLAELRGALETARCPFENVVRTWFYLGGITEPGVETQRYKELNRARTEFYEPIYFGGEAHAAPPVSRVYPASTGIGMAGAGLTATCMALQTDRPDVLLRPLENPRQIPAYEYSRHYSHQSPKFSRAMTLVLGRNVTTWISGTASIVNSESQHPGDIVAQTEQTIDNIASLISPANFAAHAIPGAGCELTDLAKIRVYLKRPEDYLRCREVCERRFAGVPAIYAVADVCRPELLVEIEGMAFSRREPA
jgi:enamine deaminase RidA (YjgF/YER057c/UK114 family)